MKNKNMGKGVVFCIILLFIGASMVPGIIGESGTVMVDYEQNFTNMVNEYTVFNTETVFSSINDAQIWKWAQSAGGTNYDWANGVAVDNDGNAIITGYFKGTATFGVTNLTSAGSLDIFVAKLDKDGAWQWAVSAGGSSYDWGEGVAVDSSGNVYLTGLFCGSAWFGNILLISEGSDDVFVAKLNSNGEWQWVVRAGGTNSELGNGVAVDNNGNVIITGRFRESVSFGPFTLTSVGECDVFVAKLNCNGDWLWAVSAGGSSYDNGIGVALDASGGIYIIGYFEGIATFGSTMLTSEGDWDVFVAKLNSDGVWQWAKSAGGSGYDEGRDIAVDSSGNVIITGNFHVSASFGPFTLTSVAESSDVFVAKLNCNGDWLWAVSAGGSSYDNGIGVALDASGGIYIIGYFEGIATFGSTMLTSEGDWDVFVAKLNSDGVWQWAKSAGGSGYDEGRDIAVDSSGNVIITGNFHVSASFGPFTLTSVAESSDVFVAKLNCIGDWLWAVSAGGSSGDHGSGVAMDSGGKVYVTGSFQCTATFGSATITSAGSSDVFVAKLNCNGDWLWAVSAGGTGWDWGTDVAVSSSGIVYAAGNFQDAAWFGSFNLTSAGESDVFIAKLAELPVSYLSCTGSLNWFFVKPGSTVKGVFNVLNAGDPESLLDWEIVFYPSWGVWTFDPDGGVGLTPEAGTVTVNVEVVAPMDKNTEFTGQVVLVNSDDPDHTCTIEVALATPVSYQSQLMKFFQRLVQQFPSATPMLQNLLGV
jgi:hypothetical protein